MFYISGFYKFKKIYRTKKAKKYLTDIFDKYKIRETIIIYGKVIMETKY